jgi:hypothetical protein
VDWNHLVGSCENDCELSGPIKSGERLTIRTTTSFSKSTLLHVVSYYTGGAGGSFPTRKAAGT